MIRVNKYYCFNRTANYKDKIEEIIQNKKLEILLFFGIEADCDLNLNIYMYDTIEDLVNGMKERNFDDMPDYMCACQKDEDNSLNFFEPKDDPSENEWSKDEYENVIFHELIHAIQFNIYGTQPEWLTEGVAKYLDGTYKNGMKWLFENYIHQNRIPTMYELENEFGEHEYDSYDYAYIMVNYLIDNFGKEEFLRIIGNKKELDNISQNLIMDSINYYNNKYFEVTKR